jgi:hypothetical protein
MENKNNEILKTKEAIKNKLPTEHNFGLNAYLEYLEGATE